MCYREFVHDVLSLLLTHRESTVRAGCEVVFPLYLVKPGVRADNEVVFPLRLCMFKEVKILNFLYHIRFLRHPDVGYHHYSPKLSLECIRDFVQNFVGVADFPPPTPPKTWS